MALPNGSSSPRLLPSPTPFPPAKTPLILRPYPLILHPLPPSHFCPRPKPKIPPRTRRASSIPPQKYVYPDPIPEFAQSETEKFRTELFKKLSKDKETFGLELDKVVEVCSQIFGEFLHEEYGGPGTLLVEPFTDMLVALKNKKLPGAPLAARAALLWAQNHVDQDWEIWNSNHPR